MPRLPARRAKPIAQRPSVRAAARGIFLPGVIASVGSPNTVLLDGAATTAAVQCPGWYSPSEGDRVYCVKIGSRLFVVWSNGAGSGGGGGTTVTSSVVSLTTGTWSASGADVSVSGTTLTYNTNGIYLVWVATNSVFTDSVDGNAYTYVTETSFGDVSNSAGVDYGVGSRGFSTSALGTTSHHSSGDTATLASIVQGVDSVTGATLTEGSTLVRVQIVCLHD